MCFLVFRPYLDAIVIYEKEKEAHSRIILKQGWGAGKFFFGSGSGS